VACGFSLFMLKAVFGGRGDEIVDLAKVNLFYEVELTDHRRLG
jgi:hypothetical protein